jgi:hypothetical protein
MIVQAPVDESSLRYPGWRVVLACFLVALFIFGFGLYGHAVYLAELQRLHGWSTGLISNASTLSFLLGSLLAAFTNDAIIRIGAGRLLLCGAIGFTRAMLAMTAVMILILVPVVIGLIGVSPGHRPSEQDKRGAPALSRRKLLRHFGFWTITAPFALALLAQVGFIVHQIALLEPAMGRALAALAVAVTTTMAVIGRLCLGVVVDRLDPRMATAVSLVTQAAAVFAIAETTDTAVLFMACAVYGFSIGNLITLPPLIIHREFAPSDFGTALGLSTAVCGIVSACGPGIVGYVRGASGGYGAALMLCLTLQLVSAAIVLRRPGDVTPA